jgi:homocysteine S-methyltransferase
VPSLADRLRSGLPVLLDGATGTELERRGFPLARPGWSARALDEAPELLTGIHRDYAQAGAEVLTANTFRLHARNLAAWGCAEDAQRLCDRAITLARAALTGAGWVAASLAPVADCYAPEQAPDDDELRAEHHATARRLQTAGADVLLIETMGTVREAVIASQAAAATGLPMVVSFACGSGARLLSGEPLEQAVAAVHPWGPSALAVNCLPVADVPAALAALQSAAAGTPWGVYANTGEPTPSGWRVTTASQPAVYAVAARLWRGVGARLIGGCCGTTPAHIAALQLQLSGDVAEGAAANGQSTALGPTFD